MPFAGPVCSYPRGQLKLLNTPKVLPPEDITMIGVSHVITEKKKKICYRQETKLNNYLYHRRIKVNFGTTFLDVFIWTIFVGAYYIIFKIFPKNWSMISN